MLNLAYNDQALSVGAWWWFVPPGLCIALLGMGLALINFSLDELLNPRLRVYRPPGQPGPPGPAQSGRSPAGPVERGVSAMTAAPPLRGPRCRAAGRARQRGVRRAAPDPRRP